MSANFGAGGGIRSETWAGGWNGIQTCTLVPTPTADLSIACPPCAAAIACTMDSPRPLPWPSLPLCPPR